MSNDYSWIQIGVKAVIFNADSYPELIGEIITISSNPFLMVRKFDHKALLVVDYEESRELKIKVGSVAFQFCAPLKDLKPYIEDDKLPNWEAISESDRYHTLFESEKEIRELEVGANIEISINTGLEPFKLPNIEKRWCDI